MPDDLNLRATERAIFRSALDAREKLLLLAIFDHWSRTEPDPWPGEARLAGWTSLSRRTVVRTVAALEKRGVLVVTRAPGLPNRYELSRFCVESLPVPPCHQCQAVTGDSVTGDQCQPDTGVVPTGHGSSATVAPEGIQEGSQEGIQEGSQPLTLLPVEPVVDPTEIVFAYWRDHLWSKVSDRKPKLSDPRRKAIKKALRDGYTLEDLQRVVDAVARSEWHLGKNEDGKTHIEPELIFRTTKIDGWLNVKEPTRKGQRAQPAEDPNLLAGRVR